MLYINGTISIDLMRPSENEVALLASSEFIRPWALIKVYSEVPYSPISVVTCLHQEVALSSRSSYCLELVSTPLPHFFILSQRFRGDNLNE